MKSGRKNVRLLPYLFVLLQGLIYGIGDPISKAAYEVLPVYSLLSVRYLIALVTLLLFAGRHIWRGLKACSPRDWLAPSLCIAASYICSNIALELTEATSVAFIRSLSTVFAPILALVLFRKRYSWKHILIQLLTVAGLYLLCGLGGLSGFGLGEALTLLSAVLMAGALVFGERALAQVDPLTLTAVQAAASTVMAAVCALVFDGGWSFAGATLPIWGVIVYMAVGCTVGGYLLQNAALGSIPSRTVAVLQCFCPVMTALFSFLILDERLTPAGLAGAALILVCVAAETVIAEKADFDADGAKQQ